MMGNRAPSAVEGQPAVLQMSEYTFAEPGKKWLLRVSTNNQAMRVTRIWVSSRWDFEVEEIVCGGNSWGARPREAIASEEEVRERQHRRDLYSLDEHLRRLATLVTFEKVFTPPDPGLAVVPRGSDQLVLVISNRGSALAEPASSLGGHAQIDAVAVGCTVDDPTAYRWEASRLPPWKVSACRIEEYLEQVRDR